MKTYSSVWVLWLGTWKVLEISLEPTAIVNRAISFLKILVTQVGTNGYCYEQSKQPIWMWLSPTFVWCVLGVIQHPHKYNSIMRLCICPIPSLPPEQIRQNFQYFIVDNKLMLMLMVISRNAVMWCNVWLWAQSKLICDLFRFRCEHSSRFTLVLCWISICVIIWFRLGDWDSLWNSHHSHCNIAISHEIISKNRSYLDFRSK